MDHGYFKDRLSAYIDRELTPEDNQAVADHLEECAECRQELARFRELDRLVEERSGLDGEDYFEQSALKIEQRLGLAETEITDISTAVDRRFKGLWWKVTSVAASAAILTFIGLHTDEIFDAGKIASPVETKTQQQLPADTEESDIAGPTTESDAVESTGKDLGADRAKDEPSEPSEEREVSRPVELDEQHQEPAIAAPAPESAPSAPESGYLEQTMKQEAVTESAPSPMRAPRTAAGAAAPDQEVQAESDREDNYKQKVLDQFARPDLSKSIVDEGAANESIALDITEDDYQPSLTLEKLVARRDSLESQISAARSVGRSRKQSRLNDYNSLSQVTPKKDSSQVSDSLEARLLDTYYWIAKTSTDSTQVAESRQELERIASDSTSANKELASEYLRRLSNK